MSPSEPIIEFSVDPQVIAPGGYATVRWRVEGVKAVYFFPRGEPWQAHGVVGVGEQQVCPAQTTEYRLRVIKRDDSVEVRQVAVQVQDRPQREFSQQFWVDRADIRPGECVTFGWRVTGVQAVYFHPEHEPWQNYGVVGEGQQPVCPQQTATYCLRVVLPNSFVQVDRITIRVQDRPEPEVVQMFAADRTEIRPGECVTFRWRVEGVKAVYFHAKDNPWQDKGVTGEGEAQRCPQKTNTFCLRVILRDDSVEIHSITIQVK